jgi:hypothetical protein
MIWLSNFSARQSSIAVSDAKTADDLRNGVGFAGVIFNLQALDYPNMDHMHPTYVFHFRES